MKNLQETGLSEKDLLVIRNEIDKIADIQKVVLFGSRAKGTQKRGSDVDLALSGSNLHREDLTQLSYKLNQETYLPYHFDLMSLSDADKTVRDHIKRVGILIYPGAGL